MNDVPIFVAPHERAEAIEAYGDYLTDAQKEVINDAPEGAAIWLKINFTVKACIVTVEPVS